MVLKQWLQALLGSSSLLDRGTCSSCSVTTAATEFTKCVPHVLKVWHRRWNMPNPVSELRDEDYLFQPDTCVAVGARKVVAEQNQSHPPPGQAGRRARL